MKGTLYEDVSISIYYISRSFLRMRNVSYKCCRESQNIIYNKPTRCNSGSIVFINNYKYALHVSDALCVHHQEHYKL